MCGLPFPSMTMPTVSDIDRCLLRDRPRLNGLLRDIQGRLRRGLPADRSLARLGEELAKSEAQVEARRGAQTSTSSEAGPAMDLALAEGLPVSVRAQEIAALIKAHQVVVLCGETGSGKSTQLPKLCLALGYGLYGRIGHTQPRRIAARSLATRIAAETGTELGSLVGYRVRFADQVSARSRLKLLTDGMLLAEIQGDRDLLEYDCLIIDEAHERSLNIDFLLGYLKQLLPRRPELKVIITSATIDPERFARFFDAPILGVEGRTYPVELRYRPLPEVTEDGLLPLHQGVVDAVKELADEARTQGDWGDILIFLSGEREIRETAELLRQQPRRHLHEGLSILPLFARQSSAEQGLIFRPDGTRRIILATNVAETSLTVPGVRHVIDAGRARISRYSHRAKVQRLPVEPIAQASANQRSGRCGRQAPGICIRLFAEDDFLGRPAFTEPEIQRTNLAAVILQMKILGFGDIQSFPFLDPPDARLIKDGYRQLHEIGALDGLGQVTQTGHRLVRLPLDPRLGRMLLEAGQEAALREVLVITAALSVQDPRERPLDKRQQADEAHAHFQEPSSDFMGLLKLWDFLEQQRLHLSRRKFSELCRRHFLSWTRVLEWRDIHQQLRLQMHDMGYRENETPASLAQVHRAILSGLLSNLGCKGQGKQAGYQGARGIQFHILPGSALFKSQPKWLMATELVETSRLYGRTLGSIEPEWVEQAAGPLLTRTYSDPHWQSRRGQVAAYEKLSLYGLVLVPRRRINYGPIAPAESRELFIRSALVDGDFDTKAPFWRHNQMLIEQIRDMEAKSRRPDILFDEERLYAFYLERVPEGIYSQPQFEGWLRTASQTQPKLLHLRLEDLLRPEVTPPSEAAFPNRMDFGGLELPLRYAFEPGRAADGLSLEIPLAVLRQVDAAQAEWLVPGLLAEKIEALLRTLPKALRKELMPLQERARLLAETMAEVLAKDSPTAASGQGRHFLTTLGEIIQASCGVQVAEDLWQPETLPDYLRPNYRVLDAAGAPLAEGRDLQALKQCFADAASTSFADMERPFTRHSGMRDWDCGPIPESVRLEASGVALLGFPALVDEGNSVGLQLLDAPEVARASHRQGLRRLLLIRLGQRGRGLRRQLPPLAPLELHYLKAPVQAGRAASGPLWDDLENLILDRCFLDADGPDGAIRDPETFEQRLEGNRSRLMGLAQESYALLAEILALYNGLRQALATYTQVNWRASLDDMREQLDALVYQGFLAEVPFEHLRHYPRYLKALQSRLDKLGHRAARDLQLLEELRPELQQWQGWWARAKASGRRDERLQELRWLFEELRVSLFAQELGTLGPISLQRIRKRRQAMGL